MAHPVTKFDAETRAAAKINDSHHELHEIELFCKLFDRPVVMKTVALSRATNP
jgi:hypothetical protein